MSKVCKLMIFVAAFGLSFAGNVFADEPVVDTAPVVAQPTDIAKDVKADENKTAKEEKKAEKKAMKKHHHKKHEKKAEQEKEMQAKDLNEKDKQ